MDALNRVFKPFGKKERAEFAKQKAKREEFKAVRDPVQVRKNAEAFRMKIAEERKRLGL